MNTASLPQVTARDRLSTTITLAIAVHAIVILGISFTATLRDNSKQQRPLEIVIANTRSVEAPEDAKNIAQFNQQASGRSDTPGDPGSPFAANRPTENPDISPIEQTALLQERNQAEAKKVLTSEDNAMKVVSDDNTEKTNDAKSTAEKLIQERELKMARLAAEIKQAEQQYAERPRVHFVDALSAKSAVEALYVKEWVRKVESMGNLNYPSSARAKKLNGRMTLSVRLDSRGNVVLIEIDHSSGNLALDNSAVQIVRQAAPFLPFDETMKTQYDQIDITRTWVFRGGNSELQ